MTAPSIVPNHDGQPSSSAATSSTVDRFTVVAIAIVAYCIANLVHEGIGHGFACVLAGGRPTALNAVYFSCGDGQMTEGGKRVLAAGGSVANLALALLAWAAARLRRRKPGALHYFLWLLFALDTLMPSGYLLFSGISGYGDWALFVAGLHPAWLFRGIVSGAGALLYFVVVPRLLMPGLNVYLSRDSGDRKQRARKVALLPYLAGGITFVVASLLNPQSLLLVLLSGAAASFGGTCWLAYYPGGSDDEKCYRARAPESPAAIRRSVGWIAAGLLTVVVFIGVFGRGMKL